MRLLQQDKKGVSEVVSYVLLIIIVVAISAFVFNYIRLLIPKDKPECPEDVSIVFEKVSCSSGLNSTNLTLVLTNKGFWTVDAAYIRFGNESKKIKTWINEDEQHFRLGIQGLAPGKSVEQFYNLDFPAGKYAIEIEPAIYQDDLLVACKRAIVTQPINCE